MPSTTPTTGHGARIRRSASERATVSKHKQRLDAELTAQGFFESRDDAMRAVLAGEVSGPSFRYEKPGTLVEPGAPLHVRGRRPYVSRGGLKLAAGLDRFGLSPKGLRCLDVGCSTGGFTDVLLRRGAASVTAVDVGYGQFHWSLRNDPRVELLERTNACDLGGPGRDARYDLAVCDVSFTSVLTVLPAVERLLTGTGSFLTLVKPQFEAPAADVGRGGVVRDPAVRRAAVEKVARALSEVGLAPQGVAESPVTGAKGNHEYLVLGSRAAPPAPLDLDTVPTLRC